MAEKWADKLIDAVRYNSKHTHIDYVRSRNDFGDSIGNTTEIIS